MKPHPRLLLIAALLFSPLFDGCTSRRVVQVPQDWRAPRPQSAEKARLPGVMKDTPRPPETVQGPLLKPAPKIRESDLPQGPAATPPPMPEKKPEAQPQRLASMNRVNQAKAALAEGKPDRAIPLLEQAVQVDVYNGEAFLQLARAWRMKKSQQKALEFARKAEILLHDQPSKLKDVYLLQADLYRETGDVKKGQACQQKAQNLK